MVMEYRELLEGETRTIDASDDGAHEIEAKVCSYGVGPDTYRTTWKQGCFTDGLRENLPAVCWGHDSRSVIGSVIDYRDESDGLYVRMRMANFDDVPKAREAYSLIRDGHIKGWSFGYANGVGAPDPQYRGAHQYQRAKIFEISPVLRGSVPLTRTVSVRSADGAAEAADEESLTRIVSAALATSGTRSLTITIGDDGTVDVGGDPATMVDSGDAGIGDDGSDSGQGDLSPAAFALAVDAALDACCDLIAANDLLSWPAAAQQLAALVTAASVAADGLLDVMGVPDPDDTDDGERAEAELAAAADVDALAAEGERAAVSDKPWSDFSEADYTLEQYRRACLIVRNEGKTKDDCSLPVREPDGTLNRNAVHAAASRIGQVDAPADVLSAAKDKLRSLYAQLGEDAPAPVSGTRAPSPLDLSTILAGHRR